MSRSDRIGQILGGRYRIEEILGQGGMSSVYKAFDPNLQRQVAIKLIHPHLSADPKFTARFEEEARVVANLRHPNIVQVYDFNHDGDLYYMVQEYLPGETLQSKLQRLNETKNRMALTEAIQCITDVCNAVGYAHRFGMIHRDIKPANIMLDENGSATLMDFGIVKLLGGEAHTSTGQVVGTVLYMAPELIRGETPDARSDIYSLGITLFEMLSGHPPFEADSAMTVMMMHQNDPVPDIHELRPEVSEATITVVRKALAKAPADRYKSADEMVAALKQISSESPTTPEELPTLRVTRSEFLKEARQEDLAGNTVGVAADGSRHGSTVVVPESGQAYAAKSTSLEGASGTSAQIPEPTKKKNNMLPFLAGGGMIAILLFAGCLLVAGIALRQVMQNGDGGFLSAQTNSTATFTYEPTEILLTFTPVPSATPITAATPNPALAFLVSTPEAGKLAVRIDQISIDDQGNYLVDYQTFDYTEKIPGQHIHFFFNSAPKDQAGSPENGSFTMYGGPRPFAGYKVSDRPEEATEICALVAEADHKLHQGSGNCYPLPDVTQAIAKTETACRFGPGDEYPSLTTIEALTSSRADGLSPDESWWYVVNPSIPESFCWVSTADAVLSGDISSLALVEAPPLPTGPVIGDSPFVEITGISIDDQDEYVTEYTTHNFTEHLPGTHMHFFFNSTPADQTGINGEGSRLMHGGPSPFEGYKASDRPQDATELCVLVANPDHSVQPDSGNCFPLPDLPVGLVSSITSCYAKADALSDPVTQLTPQTEIKLLGVSPDRSWVYIDASEDPTSACWIPASLADVDADISKLTVIGAILTPTPIQKSEPNEPRY
jgi:serine/threonine protein kinase